MKNRGNRMGKSITDQIEDKNMLGTLEGLLEKAYQNEAAGKLEDALIQTDEIIKRAPGLAEAHNLKGVILDQLGQKAEAIEAFREALRCDPAFHDAQQNLADIQSAVQETAHRAVQFGRARTVAIKGAIIFSLALVAAAILQSAIFLNPFRLEFAGFQMLFVIWRAITFAAATGAAMAIIGSQSFANGRSFALVTILATGLTLVIVSFSYTLSGYNIWSADAKGLFSINYQPIPFMFAGAVMGILIGFVQKNRMLSVWLALAGLTGFGFYEWAPPITADVDIFIKNTAFRLLNGLQNRPLAITVAYAFQESIWSAIAGAIVGGLIGWVLGWYAPILEQEENEL